MIILLVCMILFLKNIIRSKNVPQLFPVISQFHADAAISLLVRDIGPPPRVSLMSRNESPPCPCVENNYEDIRPILGGFREKLL